jgi:hypothetical protein
MSWPLRCQVWVNGPVSGRSRNCSRRSPPRGDDLSARHYVRPPSSTHPAAGVFPTTLSVERRTATASEGTPRRSCRGTALSGALPRPACGFAHRSSATWPALRHRERAATWQRSWPQSGAVNDGEITVVASGTPGVPLRLSHRTALVNRARPAFKGEAVIAVRACANIRGQRICCMDGWSECHTSFHRHIRGNSLGTMTTRRVRTSPGK